MKKIIIIFCSVLLSSCSISCSLEHVNKSDPNYEVCVNHKKDYEQFKAEFKKEHNKICKDRCSYTPSMIRNSDIMYRIAGTYYLINCDNLTGRLH